ncbi:MAG TPA: hydroxymethylglutaryl-CoA lyase [Gaiellaceae bacterium]|nr:hydroxymethylglutaryl-CoA lyase [Gaiellaceae bacterium]
MRAIEIRDVCPRDGLQDYEGDVPTARKAEIIRRIHAVGIRAIEVTSFVSPKAVPQLSDAEALLEELRHDPLDGTVLSAFVATRDGAERALLSGIAELSTTVPATDGMTRANFRRHRAAMLDEVIAMRRAFADQPMSITIAVAFGCPFDGVVPPSTVLTMAEQLAEAGYDRLFLGDTIGVANPDQVSELVSALAERVPGVRLGGHFHDARGSGVANVVAAVRAGATLIDAALAGMGGCPFVAGAAGNVATEDVVWLLHDMGYEVGVELSEVAEASRWLRDLLDLPVRSRTPNVTRFEWEQRVTA